MARETRQATIALVGIDGAGKTTQAMRLTRWLAHLGHPVRYRLAANGRRMLGNTARKVGRPDSVALLGPRLAIRAETLLRHANLATVGHTRVLIADRYDVCQYARTRVVCPELEPWVRKRLSRLPRPDLTIYLDVAPETAHVRVKSRGIDDEPVDVLGSLDCAYRSLPEFRDFTTVDANRDADSIAESIRDEVRSALPHLLD
ncbi:MAG: dTMP kinase [Stackebrandtia sp.]